MSDRYRRFLEFLQRFQWVAGEKGGGKSTFLRQFITGLYLNDTSAQFTLIDLKAGLEFFIFRGLERMNCITDLDRAIVAIGALENEVSRRFRILEQSQSRDLDQYKENNGNKLSRHIIVIDEVAELFLGSSCSIPLISQKPGQL